MMKLLLSLLFVLSFANAAHASSNNTQTFELISFKDGDTTIIVIQENITGAIADPPGVFLNHTIKWSKEDTVAVVDVKESLARAGKSKNNDVIELQAIDGVYTFHNGGKFSLPEVDSTFKERFGELAVWDGTKLWYQNCKSDCVRDVVFEKVKAQRIYQHPGGIYINYRIKSAIYDEPAGVLLLLTDQPVLAAGLNTMHGVLLYKILR